jgi:putative endonuclease
MPYVYIVECSDGSLYTGWSIDVEARVKVHNAGRGARYTKMHRPVKLVYSETHRTRKAAMKREVAIKKWPREKKLKLISDQLISDRGSGKAKRSNSKL